MKARVTFTLNIILNVFPSQINDVIMSEVISKHLISTQNLRHFLWISLSLRWSSQARLKMSREDAGMQEIREFSENGHVKKSF